MSPISRPLAARKRSPALGELAFIEAVRRRAAAGSRTRELQRGIGDDCAVLRPRNGEDLVITTDLSLEGRHFRRDWHSPESIGHRALARSLSDLAAMGARPVAAFLSLALPRSLARQTRWVNSMLDGLLTLAEQTGTPLAGGDTSESPTDLLLLDVILLGAVPRGQALLRSGARPGDRLFVTGALGGAAAELKQLENKPAPRLRRSAKISAEDHPHLFPEPRLDVGRQLLRRGLASAAIDISDGLSTDLHHLCQASGVAAVVEAVRLPLHSLLSSDSSIDALQRALHGGEDYELLFTAPAAARVPRTLGGVKLTEIGSIVARRRTQPVVTLRDVTGRAQSMPAGGWEHLR